VVVLLLLVGEIALIFPDLSYGRDWLRDSWNDGVSWIVYEGRGKEVFLGIDALQGVALGT
jgi:hypothetical protein